MDASRKIVVLVDFLDNTDRIVDYAVSIAAETAATPHFLHVVNVHKDDPMLENIFVDRCEKSLLANAELRMAQLVNKTSQKQPACSGEVVAGKPLDKIIELARGCHSDLIMIGPNGL